MSNNRNNSSHWRQLFEGHRGLGLARKFVVAVTGGTVLLIGLAMVVLPGPAFLVIPLGLAILATQFVWARRWLKRLQNLIPQSNKPHPAPMENRDWHQLSTEEISALLKVDLASGLTAGEVRLRRQEFGLNRLSLRPGLPAWVRFLHQFNQPLVWILLITIGVTAYLGEWMDSSVIFSVVLVNAFVGYLQESKSERAIEALAGLVKTESTVRREGGKHRIPSEELVTGDVVLLNPGDRVPADLRLVLVRNLQVDESTLTGESLPVSKHSSSLLANTILAERKNLAYAGTLVSSGQAEGVVWAIGDQTETGRIARLVSGAVEPITPLGRKITEFSQVVLWVILALALLTFGLGVARGERTVSMFLAAVALAVGALPEGLPAAVTIVLAIGVSRMAKRQAIIRKLPAVETLGSTTVICSDKTGTLTENQMTVREIYAGGRLYSVTGTGYESKGEILAAGTAAKLKDHPALAECLRGGLLCNDSQLSVVEGKIRIQGDPTEAAFLVAAAKGGLIQTDVHHSAPRLDMIPFEPVTMFRATLHDLKAGRMIYQVGALDRILDHCTNLLGPDDTPLPLVRKLVQGAAENMARQGLRVLAVARRSSDPTQSRLEPSHVSNGLTFVGLQGMMDPPRAAAIAAIRKCQRAGIAVKMITGDHLATARTIAGQIGLKGPEHEGQLLALAGRELELISDADLPRIADQTTVFARVAPEQKLRIVKALQAQGQVVAMTGDGVNDAPALKQADIGIAMGIGGTEVAKAAAAMILTDDNFATIEAAVEEGRAVFDNLNKFIIWIIPTNLGEALMLLGAILFNLPLPLVPLQLLWINLTDTLLGLSLAFEKKEPDVMRRPPRPPKQSLLSFPLMRRTALVSIIMLAGGLGLFLWELRLPGASLPAARTVAANTIVLVQTLYLYNCRTLKDSVFKVGLCTNRVAIAGMLAMVSAQVLFTYAPFMNRLFHTAPIDALTWLRIVAVASIAFVAVELEKWLSRSKP